MIKTDKKIAVIGTGGWGKNLVRNFYELGVLKAICDNNGVNLAEVKNKYGIEEAYSDVRLVLEDRNIDAVIIATPAATHYQLAKLALEVGKDIFVEKPLALNVEEARELITLASQKNKILMVDHLLQYHPAITKLKELIDQGVLGKLQYIYSNRLNIGKLRNEENILWSFAPHDISVILGLVQKEPISLDVFGQAYIQDDIFDTTITHLAFPDRLRAHIYVSWLHPFKEHKLVVIGNKSMAVFNDLERENKLLLYPHKIDWIKQSPVAAKAEQEVIPVDQKEPLKEACHHFLSCITERTQPKTNGEEAIAVLGILQQAQEQLDKKKNHGKGNILYS